MNDQEYEQLKGTIRRLTNVNLDNYKTQQMRRRLDGLAASQAPTIADYCKLIEQNRDALTKLKNFITINVSEFFRDHEQFNILKTTVLPELLRSSPRLNIWSAGCSHGGEPYSIAMILEELSPGLKHRIIATDLDEDVLVRAKSGGPYAQSDVVGVEPKLLLKYFTKAADGYRLPDGIKQKVEFKRQNMLNDVFERGFDLIVCRNVVIYFSDEAKEKLYKAFYQSLKEHGVLFIGATETLLDAAGLGLERMHNCFYRKTAAAQPRLNRGAAASPPAPRR